jgi:cytochrome P460
MRRLVFVLVAVVALPAWSPTWPPRLDRPMERPPRSSESKSPRIPRLEVDLRGPRRRQTQRSARHSGQRRSDQGLPGREASVPGRYHHCPARLELRPVGGKRKSLCRLQSFVAGQPKNGVQFMVKDSRKYASTGGWGFAYFDDGKPADEAVHNTCFSCHETVKARDFVFNRYAP